MESKRAKEEKHRNTKLEATKIESNDGKEKNRAKSIHTQKLKTKFGTFDAI